MLRQLHEVTLNESHLVLKTGILGVLVRTGDLVVVVVETDDVHIRESCNLTCRTANTTTDVEHAHTGAEVHLGGEVVFVAGEGGTEAFAFVETREVERAGPGVLV